MTEKQTQQNFEEEQREHYAQLYERIRPQVEQGIVDGYKKRQRRKKQLRAYLPIAATLIVVLCLGIVLPITLGQDSNMIRYDNSMLMFETLDVSVKDYVISTNEDVIYPNWYDDILYRQTKRYYDVETENTVYLCEQIIDTNGNSIEYSYVSKNFLVEALEDFWKDIAVTEHLAVNKVDVQYTTNLGNIYARFEVNEYKYYLQIDNIDVAVLQSTLENLLK